MRVVFTIYYQINDNVFLIFNDDVGVRTDFNCGSYSDITNSYLVYYIIHFDFKDYKKTYVGSYLYLTKLDISNDYDHYVKKHTKKRLLINAKLKKCLIILLIKMLKELGYNLPKNEKERR